MNKLFTAGLLAWALGMALPADAGDYEKMISEMENHRAESLVSAGEPLPGKPGPAPVSGVSSLEMQTIQKRWDSLKRQVMENETRGPGNRDLFQSLEKDAEEALEFLQGKSGPSPFIQVACARNLELQSVKKELESKLEKYSQVEELEDLLVQIASFMKDLELPGSMDHRISIRQYFPFPGALALKASLAEQEVRIAKTKYGIAARDLVADVKTAFFDWAFAGQARAVIGDHLELMQDLETIALAHFRTGKGNFNDVLEARIGIARLEEDLENIEEEASVFQAQLVQYLDLGAGVSFTPPSSIPRFPLRASLPELETVALKHHQELRLVSEELDKSRYAIELAEKTWYPDLAPGFSYFEDKKGYRTGAVKDRESFETRPPRPSLLYGENDAFIREARLHHQALAKKLGGLKEELVYKIRRSFFEVGKSAREIALYENKLLPLAASALDSARANYRTGRSDFLDVLQAQGNLLNFRLGYQTALKDHGRSGALLERQAGKPLFQTEVENEPAKN